MTLTPERIAEIEARVSDATLHYNVFDLSESVAFMAHCCEDIPDLLADRKQLLSKIQELEADNKKPREALDIAQYKMPVHDVHGG